MTISDTGTLDSSALAERRSRTRFRIKAYIFYLAWSVPTVMFVLNPSCITPAWPVWTAVLCTLLLAFLDNRFFSLGIPFAGLLSPLAKSTEIMGLLPGELYIGGCSLFLLFRFALTRRITAGSAYKLPLFLLVIAAISSIFSIDAELSVIPMINWVAIAVVFLITCYHAQSPFFAQEYLKSLIVLSVFVSVVIISGYINNMNLAFFMNETEKVYIVDFENPFFFFRGSFWYTNILYLLGPGLIAAIVYSFYAKFRPAAVFTLGAIIIILTSFVVTFNKTAMYGIVGVASMLLLKSIRKIDARNIIFSLIAVLILLGVLFNILPLVIKQPERLNLSLSSFMQRLGIWGSSLDALLRNPLRLLVGYGPDISIRSADYIVAYAKQSSADNCGAIDSAYVTYLFEYGVIFLSLFVIYSFNILKRLMGEMRRFNFSSFMPNTLFFAVLFINIAAFTQVIGTSKVAWVITGIFALGASWQPGAADSYSRTFL